MKITNNIKIICARCSLLDHLLPFIIIHNLSLMERTWVKTKATKGIFELKFSQSCGGG